jgi:hypothetical protein
MVTTAMKAVGVEVQFDMFLWSRCLHMLGSSLRTRGNVIVLARQVHKDVRTLRDLDGMTIGLDQWELPQ